MELIKVENKDYHYYEELLFRRDRLRKEATVLQALYMKEFGDLVTSVFKKKIACIQKKKTIGYCQMFVNRGEFVDPVALKQYLDSEMETYRRQLEILLDEAESARNMEQITPETMGKIKKIYRRLAKKLHPDINPKTEEYPDLKRLWTMVVVAYQSNSLEELEEAEVLVNRALKNHNISDMTVEISNLDERIKKVEEEIHRIQETNPYQYKFLLKDGDAIAEKKSSLEKELREYQDYENELNSILDQLVGKGVYHQWQMN